jgi:hypothetical protein
MKFLQSFSDILSETDKKDKNARWIKRKTLKKWIFFVYQHFHRNGPFIDYLVVKAIFTFNSANPSSIEKQVKAAMRDNWYIIQYNVTVSLNIELNKYKSYALCVRDLKGNIFSPEYKYISESYIRDQLKFVYIPDELILKEKNYSLTSIHGRILNQVDVQDELIYRVSNISWSSLTNEIVITKLFFCRQVDLFPEEYDDNVHNILFKVKNVTLYDFRRVSSFVGNQKGSNEGTNDSKKNIRICLNEFHHSLNDAGFGLGPNMLLIEVALQLSRMAFSQT